MSFYILLLFCGEIRKIFCVRKSLEQAYGISFAIGEYGRKENICQEKTTAVFVTVITALLVVMVLSVAMSVHHYEKTVLITLDAAGEQAAENETGLAEIRRQLEVDKADASTGTMFWNGSVCVTKYRAWGGRTTTYYVCPYLSAVSTETIGDTPKEWTVSLSFAMCATQGEELVNFNKKFAVRDIELNCRAGKDAAILSAAYNDMDMTDINGDLLSYTFRDKEELTTDTSVYAKLMMVSKKVAESN